MIQSELPSTSRSPAGEARRDTALPPAALACLYAGTAAMFNRLLQVILAHTWLVLDEKTLSDAVRPDVQAVHDLAITGRMVLHEITRLTHPVQLEREWLDTAATLRETATVLGHLLAPEAVVTAAAPDGLPTASAVAQRLRLSLVVLGLSLHAAVPQADRLQLTASRCDLSAAEAAARSLPITGPYVQIQILAQGGNEAEGDPAASLLDPATAAWLVRSAGGWLLPALEDGVTAIRLLLPARG